MAIGRGDRSNVGGTNEDGSPARKGPLCPVSIFTGFSIWVGRSRTSIVVLLGIFMCALLVALLPPISVLHGWGEDREPEIPADQSVSRLLVHFDQLGKTVKSKVSPLLHDYIDEVLLSFGVNVVTFAHSGLLEEVQRYLEAQPDVLILLRDRPQYQAPAVDPFQGFKLRGAGTDSASSSTGRRRELQTGSAGSTATTADTLEAGDELQRVQWSLEKVAARQAWNLSRGEQVIVSVIDTGCDLEHPDLKANIWVNKREIPGNNIDDDRNGFIDDVNGFDFAGPCESPRGPGCGGRPVPADGRGHGSHCSGIIGAVRNNRVGIAGIAPNVTIMCLKVTPNSGVFYTGPVLQALDYALANGAHIVSCSFGPERPLPANATDTQRAELRNETALYALSLAALRKKGMLMVAAAGNELANLDNVDHYNPCTLVRDFPDVVMCVMATDDLDQRLRADALFPPKGSNYGPNTVSIGAPGLQILSTVPPLPQYNHSRWTNMSGSSMATPLVAGTAALVASILGSRDGNLFQGPATRAVLMDSGAVVLGLEAARGHRLNASAAVQMALARVSSANLLVPQTGFSRSEQWVLMEGFNLTYYSSTLPEPDPATMLDESTLATRVSRLEGYKLAGLAGVQVVVRASMNLSREGMYLIKINTTANPADLRVFVGQVQLTNLSASHLILSNGGWYTFEMRYVNPSAPIDILMAEAPGSGAPALRYPPGVFFVASDAPPRTWYYAPNIVLSSTWQVLAREPRSAAPDRGSSLRRTALDLDQPFNYTAVVEAINFTASTTTTASSTSPPGSPAAAIRQGLRDALGLSSGASGGEPLVGIAHTRLRPPEGTGGTLRFKIVCELCALYVNGLRVADVYDPVRRGRAVSQLTNCVALGGGNGARSSGSGSSAGSVGGLHDLVLRFFVSSPATASLVVGWLDCEADDDSSPARPLGPLLMNNLFWRPSSGVAGYVSGMQCDVWLDGDDKPPPSSSPTWQPLIKFRLPTALAQTTAGIARTLPSLLTRTDPPVYDTFMNSRCAANETAAGGNCSAALAFTLTHIVNRGLDLLGPTVAASMRCWTFVNGGFSNGTVQTRRPGLVTVYLGAQTVLQSPLTNSIYFPSIAPNSTSLRDYHQLLVVELPRVGLSVLNAVQNGTMGDLLTVDMTRTLLPIPLLGRGVAPAAAAATGGSGGSATSGQRRRRRRRRHLTAHHEGDGDGDEGGGPGDAGEVRVTGAARLALQQEQLQQSNFIPSYLGANPYTAAGGPGSLPRFPGVCGRSFTPDAAYNAQTQQLATVFHNISLTATALRGTPCLNASSGLAEPLCYQPPNRTFARFVQLSGFLRIPASAAPPPRPAAAAAGQPPVVMRRWVLRVLDVSGQATAITAGDVTVRNGVEYPSPGAAASETAIFLPYSSAVQQDLYLPAVVTSRSRVVGSQAVLDVALVPPDSRAALPVNNSIWFCD